MRLTLRRFLLGWVACAPLFGLATAAEPTGRALPSICAQPHFGEHALPPWQGGTNNDAVDRGLLFTIPEVDVLADFHGDITDPKLVIFFGGNYYFATRDLVATFEASHPEYKGRIYWETIPPGRLIEQIEKNGRITAGNMTWTAKADVFFGGLKRVKDEIDKGILVAPAVPYVTNTLTIMVAKGNPRHITGLADLGKPDIHLAMPIRPTKASAARSNWHSPRPVAKNWSRKFMRAKLPTAALISRSSTTGRRRCRSCRHALTLA